MNWAIWLVFAMAAATLIGAAALAGSSSAFWYGMAKLVAADAWPRLKAYVAASSETTQKRALEDGRQAVERGVTGREREH